MPVPSLRATSHTSQEPWPWNCGSPKERFKGCPNSPQLSEHTPTHPQPFLHDLACVFGIIIMLKDQPTWIQIIILCSAPQEFFLNVVMHSQIITNPPPCFTIWWTYWGPTCSPSPIQHHDLPFEFICPIIENHTFPIINDPILIFWANLRQARTCSQLNNGFICCTCALNPTSLKARLTMMSDNNLHVSKCCCICTSKLIFTNNSDMAPLLSVSKNTIKQTCFL